MDSIIVKEKNVDVSIVYEGGFLIIDVETADKKIHWESQALTLSKRSEDKPPIQRTK